MAVQPDGQAELERRNVMDNGNRENNSDKENPDLPEGKRNYLIDIDGTICDDIPNEEPEKMVTAKMFPDALKAINKWFNEGHSIYFFTSRTEEQRQITEEWLKRHGFNYHGLITGKPRGGNYYWIDNNFIKAVRYKGDFTDLE